MLRNIEYNRLYIAVNGRSVGQLMQELHDYRKPVWSPIKFEREDDVVVIQLKALAAQMISFNPRERPAADLVLQKMNEIKGELDYYHNDQICNHSAYATIITISRVLYYYVKQ